LRPQGTTGDEGRREQAGPTALGEVQIPRQRDAETPARFAAPGAATDRRRRAPARPRPLARVWAWWRAVGTHGVTSWPELASLTIGARATDEVIRRSLRALRRWFLAAAALAGRCGLVTRRWTLAVVAAVWWCWVHLACPAAHSTGRLAHRVGVWCWRHAESPLRDVAGWVVHVAPRLVGRLLLRLLRWVPVALARLLRHAAVGLGWLLVRLVRYCLAYPEYAGLVREARELDRPHRARVAIVAWRRAATRRSLTTLVLGLAGWWGFRWLDHTHGTLAAVGVLTVLIGALAGVGRAVRPLPESEPGQTPDQPGPNDPYPIADAHTRAEAADCVARAARAEGIDLRGTEDATRTPWGWQVPVILRRGTPAGLIAKLGELETTLDLPAGALLAAPDRTRRARVVLRLAQRDPFTGLPPAINRPPASASIRDPHVVAARMDGTDLGLCLLGVHAVVIGVSGAGKSQTLRTLADAVSACADALVWDLDPAGNGLDALGGGIARRERDPAGITDALTDALALAEVRPRMLADLDMGDAWAPSPTCPALVVVIDEYPRLNDRAKALAVDLLRVGRKARVTVILAASEATSDTLGAAIADTTACKILLPCRHTDIRLVLGPNMIAEGWRPDRLHPATGHSPEDAGKAYVWAAGSREPLISQFRVLDPDRARDNGTHRTAVGLPRIDTDSWTAARARRARHSPTEDTRPGTKSGTQPRGDRQVGADVLTAFGTDHKLWTEHLLTRLATIDDRYTHWTPEDLANALRPFGITPVQVWHAGRNRNGYDRDTIARALNTE
jgi:S-DNA-T family DNA segregation ATPase FtsK/SpoIIIE